MITGDDIRLQKVVANVGYGAKERSAKVAEFFKTKKVPVEPKKRSRSALS